MASAFAFSFAALASAFAFSLAALASAFAFSLAAFSRALRSAFVNGFSTTGLGASATGAVLGTPLPKSTP